MDEWDLIVEWEVGGEEGIIFASKVMRLVLAGSE